MGDTNNSPNNSSSNSGNSPNSGNSGASGNSGNNGNSGNSDATGSSVPQVSQVSQVSQGSQIPAGATGLNPPVIVNYVLNESIDICGAHITNQQGQTASGDEVTYTTFVTESDPTIDVNITQNLLQTVESYYDDAADPETMQVVHEIQGYAAKIKCESFHGKGTIDDYAGIFEAASKIANDTKQMQLSVDISGFNEFGAAADELSKLFNGFIVRLQSISIIDDLNFLRAVAAALRKITNLSETFGKFKETILATSAIEMPKSAHDARLLVEGVMSEVNCAMTYINHFINPADVAPADANLSSVEKNIITKAVSTIDNWQVLCNQDVSIAMANSPDVVYMKNASQSLRAKASTLAANTNVLRAKLALYSNF